MPFIISLKQERKQIFLTNENEKQLLLMNYQTIALVKNLSISIRYFLGNTLSDTELIMKIKNLLFPSILFLMTTTIFAQNYYLGVGSPSDNVNSSCASCHKSGGAAQDIYSKWINTGHATAQDSLVSNPGYEYSCLECHNTGWDLAAANYGADEYVSENAGQTPNYVITDEANWNRVKNVQCESCHGAMGSDQRQLGGSHWAFGTTNVPDYSAENCGSCHQGEHYPYYEEWQASAHASGAPEYLKNRETNAECFKCHFAQDFVAYLNDPEYDAATFVPDGELQDITCVTCHDPHDNQLRVASGSQTICDVCHTVEEETVDINTEPHHTTSQALSGSANFGYQYPGETYTNSPHTFAATERCVDCHVQTTPFNSTTGIAVTGHTFDPRTEACAQASCHPNYYSEVDTSVAGKKFDYRRTQTVTDSLLTVLSEKLSSASSSDSLTDAFKEANYNYLSVEGEGSHGIHNTSLVQKLLQDAIAGFNPTSVEREEGLPSAYTLSQNYPNPFNPATEIKFSIPEAGNVILTIYDAIGKEIVTLVNNYYPAGNYKAVWNAGSYSSGIYFYNIQAGNFKAVKKMVLIK